MGKRRAAKGGEYGKETARNGEKPPKEEGTSYADEGI